MITFTYELRCNGCHVRWVPSSFPMPSYAKRAEAKAAGWAVGIGANGDRFGEDYCSEHVTPDVQRRSAEWDEHLRCLAGEGAANPAP